MSINMGEQLQSPKELTESSESHEKVEQGEPYVTWNGEVSEEAKKRVDFTAEKLAKGAELLDFPTNELGELAVLFRDQSSARMQNVEFKNGVSMSGMSFKSGDETLRFRHGIMIFLRDNNGELRSEEDINESLYHELTHRVQHIRGETAHTTYMKPEVHRRVQQAGKIALGLPAVATGAAVVQGYKGAAAVSEAGKNIMAAYEVAPHNTVAALVLGAAAVGLTLSANYMKDKFPRRALEWLYKFDRRENEARRNEVLAKKLSIVTVD